ncbi:hypothetical protein [Demequina aurantiaca]|uniref:hypothetical protein n=1 Tax=Demequina aurantiaca TaxID=676200 RepID=UPI003D3463BD
MTPPGDDSQPATTRPQLVMLIGAMVAILALAVFVAWLVFRPPGSDAAAREAAAALGIAVSDEWRVDAVDGGFNIRLASTPEGDPTDPGYAFHITETNSVAAPVDASTWTPKIAGATAYAEGEPPTSVHIDADEHNWVVTPLTLTIYQDDDQARMAWYNVANAISFTS